MTEFDSWCSSIDNRYRELFNKPVPKFSAINLSSDIQEAIMRSSVAARAFGIEDNHDKLCKLAYYKSIEARLNRYG